MSRRPQTDASGKIQWVAGDMLKPDPLDAALSGVDIVVTSANGYMKESIDTDIQGNKNLIEAAAKHKVKRFVFLSIVSCDLGRNAPHFEAKYLAEQQLVLLSVPFVSIRAPAFLVSFLRVPQMLAFTSRTGKTGPRPRLCRGQSQEGPIHRHRGQECALELHLLTRFGRRHSENSTTPGFRSFCRAPRQPRCACSWQAFDPLRAWPPSPDALLRFGQLPHRSVC